MSKDDLLSKLAKQRNTPLNQIKRLSASRAKDDKISGEGYAMLVRRAEEEEQRKKRGKIVKSALMPFVPTTIGKMAFNEYHARYGGTTGMLVKGAESPSAIHVFSPIDLLGLAGWWDASKIIGLNDGDPVGTWPDSSGNGRDATQATAAKRPIYKPSIQNGKPAVRCDGVDDLLQVIFTLDQPYTTFVAFVQRRVSGLGTIVGGIDFNASRLGSNIIAGGNTAQLYAGGPGINSGVALTTDTAFVLGGVFNGASSVLRVNGTEFTGTVGATSAGGTNIGGPEDPAQVDALEVVQYSRALSAGERQQVESYLMTKYGLS